MAERKKYSEDPRIKEWTTRSLAKNFEKLNLTRKKGLKDKYKAFAASQGMSVTEMFTRYLDSEIEKSGFVYEPENNESAE